MEVYKVSTDFGCLKLHQKQDVIQVIMRVLVLIKEIIVLVQKKN